MSNEDQVAEGTEASTRFARFALPLRRALVAVTAVAVTATGFTVLDAPAASAAAIVAPNPNANIAASPAAPASCYGLDANTNPFSGRESFSDDCQNAAIAALNNARSKMSLPAYTIPANFTSLPVADQILNLANQDRAAYGLAPFIGYNSELNRSAQNSADAYSDPTMVKSVHTTVDDIGTLGASAISNQVVTSVAAQGQSPLYSYYTWMYADGVGSVNADCSASNPTPSMSGCWGHRMNLLHDVGTTVQLAAGFGYTNATGSTSPTVTLLGQTFPTNSAVPFLGEIWSATEQGTSHQVTVTGSGFTSGFVGISSVKVNGSTAKWHLVDAHTLTVRVPVATSPVSINVTTSHGFYQNADRSIAGYSYTSPDFTFAGLTNLVANTVSLTDPGQQTSYTNAPVSLQLSATDSDNDPYTGATLTYSAANLPAGLDIDPVTGLITGTPTVPTDQYNPAAVTLTATDDTGASASVNVLWNVIKAYVTVTSPDAQDTLNGTTVSLQVHANAYGSGTLTYTATGLPDGLSINPATGLITGTLTTVGTSSVTVTATGANGPSADGSFSWKVEARPLTVTAIPDQSGSMTSPVHLQVQAVGDDAGVLTYSASGLPNGLSIDSATGLVTGTPSTNGTYPVTVMVSGESGYPVSTSFNWVISANTITLTVPPNGSNPQVGQQTHLTFTASDSDPNAKMHFSVDVLPTGLTMDPDTGTISGVPTAAGQTLSYITVTDASTASTTQYFFTVVNPAPAHATSVSASASTTVNYGSSTRISVYAYDGTSHRALTGTPVYLQTRLTTSSSWSYVGHIVTNSSGHGYYTAKPGSNSYYRWYINASTNLRASTSGQTGVGVRQVVSITQNHYSVRHGGYVYFYGTVSPNESGQYVNLNKYIRGKYVYQAHAKIAYQKMPNGKRATSYVFHVKLTTRATFSYRTSRSATSHNAAGTSRTIKIKVT